MKKVKKDKFGPIDVWKAYPHSQELMDSPKPGQSFGECAVKLAGCGDTLFQFLMSEGEGCEDDRGEYRRRLDTVRSEIQDTIDNL